MHADHQKKRKSKNSMQEKYVDQCVKEKVPVQDEISKQEYKANVYKEDDKNSQVNVNQVCSDKKCQDTKFMWPVEQVMKTSHMQSVTRSSNMKSTEQEMLQSSNKQHIHGECPVKSVCSDKNCQENKSNSMQPVKPQMDMQSKEPAIQSSFKK